MAHREKSRDDAVVRQDSLLGRALAAHKEVGEVVPPYGEQLKRIARCDDASAQFDRLAANVEPAIRGEFVSRLLSLVMFAALDAGTVASSKDTPSIPERRAQVEKRYRKLLSAIRTLERAFEMPKVRIEPSSSGEAYEETSVEVPGALPSDDPILRSAIESWRVALGFADPTSNEAGPLRTFLYRTRDAPGALHLMRAFLLGRKAAELGVTHMGTLSRRADGAAHVRTFVILLDRRLREAFGVRDIQFLATMANALFAEKDDVEFFDDGVRKILQRATKRQAKA